MMKNEKQENNIAEAEQELDAIQIKIDWVISDLQDIRDGLMQALWEYQETARKIMKELERNE